jgi:uncharacterized protein (TIGR03000 family)
MLLLVGAAVLATPGSGLAQRGGGHGGGGHFGGARIGGAHFGGVHVGGAHFGGARWGGYRGAYHYGYRPYYGSYGGYGGYPYYDNDGAYFDTYPYTSSGPGDDAWAYGPDAQEAPLYSDTYTVIPPAASGEQSSGATAAARPDPRAHVTVHVPAGAQLWFNGTEMTATGRLRNFRSPALVPGSQYSYDVRARWNANGQEVTQTRQIDVSAGAQVTLTFPLPPSTAAKAAAVPRS